MSQNHFDLLDIWWLLVLP